MDTSCARQHAPINVFVSLSLRFPAILLEYECSSAFLTADNGGAGVASSSSSGRVGGGGWNVDTHEMQYSPSTRDLDDARIYRLLDTSMLRPYRRVRLISPPAVAVVITHLPHASVCFNHLCHTQQTPVRVQRFQQYCTQFHVFFLSRIVSFFFSRSSLASISID
jgi:hypothetical protein